MIGLVAFALLTACASRPPPPPATVTTTSARASAEPESLACELECDGVQAVGVEPNEHPDAAIAEANRVVASMHDDLLACYKKRLAASPRARAFVMLDIVVAEDGRVRDVEATGGGMLGERAVRCMTTRVERATFAPVKNGGTLRFQVPLTFRPSGESI
jgi:hypothetical protein